LRGAIIWALVAGFIGAHLFAILLYAPNLLQRGGPLILLKTWRGMSSFGGLWGALLALLIYFWRLKKTWLRYADVLAQGLVVGWIFGRLGCAIAHDHVGIQSSFFLAVRYPGGPRHDLGLYEFLLTLFVFFPVIQLLRRKATQLGAYVVALSLMYAPCRFLLDFLRISNVPGADLRYWGLTPAQFSSMALFGLGLWFLRRLWNLQAPGEFPRLRPKALSRA
jgi:phosphatidylglycerol:prolipoprotein diacylglycerol transferase